jgi:hypothetical protein
MSNRVRLPNRRSAETWEFPFPLPTGGAIHCIATYGRDGSMQIKEVFLDAGKTGTVFESMACDSATLASLALQYGAPKEVLAHSMIRNPDGSRASPIGVVIDDMVMG